MAKQRDVMDVGENCQREDCGQLDFLPFECQFCKKLYCLDHRSVDAHNCAKYDKATTVVCEKCGQVLPVPHTVDPVQVTRHHVSDGCKPTSRQVHKCNAAGCKKTDYDPIICADCNRHHCLAHRHPRDHGCTVADARREAEQKERAEKHSQLSAILGQAPRKDGQQQQQQATVAAKPKRKSKTDKEKQTAARVQLMKLRLHAQAAAGVPLDDRWHLRVELPRGGSARAPLQVYVDKQWTVGKCVDRTAQMAAVPNRNNEGVSDRLQLFDADTGAALPTSSRIDSCVPNGGTVILQRTAQDSVDPDLYDVDKKL